MPDLPQKKVGIVACSGEEMAAGTVTRLAALKVLEELRPDETVTICLPLFLAGGEGDRAFARFHPTIAIDGCDKRCAARGTAMYSGEPAASVVVSDLVPEYQDPALGSARQLNAEGRHAVERVADQIAEKVDNLLGKPAGKPASKPSAKTDQQVATCACGSGIPVQKLQVGDETVTFLALPLIFEKFKDDGKPPRDGTAAELMRMVEIYNPIPEVQEERYTQAVMRAYTDFYEEQT